MPSGFLYSVKAVVDKASFAEGIGELQKLEQTSKRLITGIAGAATAAISSAAIAGEVATQELKVANAIGVSSEALSSWKIAANIAGASAGGLIGQLVSLESKMQHLKTGVVDSNLAKNLGLMGIGYGDFANMDSETRMRSVFNQANQMEDQKLAATLIGDILGQAGQDYYQSLKLSGKSIDQQLAEAKKLNFVSNQNRKEAALFASEVKSIKEAGKSITMLFGSEMAAALMPTVKSVKNYLINNREQIRKGIQGFAQNLGAVFNVIAGTFEKVVPFVTGLIDKFGGLDKIIVKVGLGFASMKLVSVAGGIMSILRSVNLLKAGFAGLLSGGFFLILDDIMTHFQGGESFLFDELPGLLQKLKESLGIDIDFGSLSKGLKDIGGAALQTTVNLLKILVDIFKDLFSMDFNKLSEDFRNLGREIKEGLKRALGGNAKEAGEKSYQRAKNNGESEVRAVMAGTAEALLANPVTAVVAKPAQEYADKVNRESLMSRYEDEAWLLSQIKGKYEVKNQNKKLWQKNEKLDRQKLRDGSDEYGAAYADYIDQYLSAGYDPKKIKKYVTNIDDGIISPSGKVTSVSPDDWVFAVKNIADLAGAFFPPSLGVDSTAGTSTSYVINQSLSVSGGASPQLVKQAAFAGTSEALSQNVRNASQRLQMMPGTR